RARELAQRQAHVRGAALRRVSDLVVELEDPDFAEVERVVLRPRTARLLAQHEAPDLVAARQIDGRHVLARPPHERDAPEHRGDAELLLRLDLANDAAVARDREEHRAAPARARERDHRDGAVVASAVEREAARRARPETSAADGIDREELAAAGA